MPIYAYKCETCGFAKDVLQKMSDTPLSICPTCEKATFKKQLTAAGFQLKGSGWYATDFKNGASGAAAPAAAADDTAPSAPAAATTTAPAKVDGTAAAPSSPSPPSTTSALPSSSA